MASITDYVPLLVLIATIVGGLWAVYAKLDVKIDTAIEHLRTALSKEIADLRERIDKFFDSGSHR